MPDAVTVTLGVHDIIVVPQSLPRLKRDIGALAARIPALTSGFEDITEIVDVLAMAGDLVVEFSYEAVCVLVPLVAKRIPACEWYGYADIASMDLDEHDDVSLDNAPTVPQIREAIRVGIEVNGLEFLGKLKGLDLD